MDHHDLDINQKFLSEFVSEIVDHHDDNGFNYTENFPRLKTKDGLLDQSKVNCKFVRCSNQCLVLEMALETKNFKEFLDKNLKSEYSYYDFLIGPIVVDSVNFDNSLKGKKWVDADLKIADTILEKCKKSFFVSNDKVEELKENNDYYKIISKELIDIKFNENKNLSLGAHALLCKDRKDFRLKYGQNGDFLNVSFHSLPVSIYKLWEYENQNKSENILSCVDSLKQSGLESELLLSLILCKDGKDGLISFYLHDESKFSKEKVEGYCQYFSNEKCEGKGSTFNENGFLHFKNKDNISRKIVLPALESYLENI